MESDAVDDAPLPGVTNGSAWLLLLLDGDAELALGGWSEVK